MFISDVDGEYRVFETEREAAEHVADTLGPDYDQRVWVNAEGQLENHLLGADFTIAVHPSAEAAVLSLSRLDPEAMPLPLRALADALERGIKAGIID